MGNYVELNNDEIVLKPAPYRNDFLHEVDIIEDVMIGCNVNAFEPRTPQDFTVGRLLPLTEFSRKAKKSIYKGLRIH